MPDLRRQTLARLFELKPGTTICPGQLSRDCGTTLAQARADILALADAGKIQLSQRGKKVAGPKIKGPFRVKLS
jgi:hypothetical protein